MFSYILIIHFVAPKKKSSLPHWWIYIAYFCIFIACSVSATFTVFYGLTFGKAKSEAWISAMMISFWQDVLISQPLKVFAAATVFALLTKDPKKATGENEEENLPSPELQEDEEFTGQNIEGRGMDMSNSFFFISYKYILYFKIITKQNE